MNFSYVSYISTSGITTLHTQDIFLEKIKNHANNLIGDHITAPNILCSSPTFPKMLSPDTVLARTHRVWLLRKDCMLGEVFFCP